MSTNRLKLQSFRTNDLVADSGKQIEFGKSWNESFFGISEDAQEATIILVFKALDDSQNHLDGKIIELKLANVTNRGDRKAYANGEHGYSQLKDFFINDLGLSVEHNLKDYFAIHEVEDGKFHLYFITELLAKNFVKALQNNLPIVTGDIEASNVKPAEYSLQTIFFGSPGTGKSFKIKDEILKEVDDNYIFRTTFHPDTDYSSFVGCYKPTTTSKTTNSHAILGYDSLVIKLKEYLDRNYIDPKSQKSYKNVNKACVVFGFDYYDSIIAMLNEDNDLHSIKSIISSAYGKDNTTYDTPLRAGMSAREAMLESSEQATSIVYKFMPQTFTNAYVKAWQKPSENVYLVIEEINRGNCAQIFGDLFQLLDRDEDGISEYPIKADADLRKYLEDTLGTEHEAINSGEIKLPRNLYILATMNTSDQSLFPMDSAFKRRWEWQYVPTSVTGDKKKILKIESKEETLLVNRDMEQKVLKLGMYQYDWSLFLEKINKCITDATHSDDKQLGFWFVKTPKGSNEIKIETFVSKVIFYLWTDVFKDFGARATNPFAFKNAEGGWVVCPFSSFFDSYTGEINLGQIHGFMYNLGIIPDLEPDADAVIKESLQNPPIEAE